MFEVDRNLHGSVLEEAHKVINGERQDAYGHPEDSFQIIAELWSVYISRKFRVDVKLTGVDTAVMLSLFKHARMMGSNMITRDTIVDACGYLAILGDRLTSQTT